MILIIWRSGRIMGALIIFLLVFAVFTVPFVWHPPWLAFWYKQVGPVVGVVLTIAALTLALRK